MKKLKWKYVKSEKAWKTIGHYRKLRISEYEFGEFVLQWDSGTLKLFNRKEEMILPIATFKKLNKAMKVAQLIYEG